MLPHRSRIEAINRSIDLETSLVSTHTPTTSTANSILNLASIYDSQLSTTSTSPAELPSSRGPVSAEVMTTPELADNPRHSVAAGRGTDKGGNSYPPEDNAGLKTSKKPASNPVKEQSWKRCSTTPSASGRYPQRRALPESARTDAALYDLIQFKHTRTPFPTAGRSSSPLHESQHVNQEESSEAPSLIRTPRLPEAGTRLSIAESSILTTNSPTRLSRDNSSRLTTKAPLAIQWNMNGFYNNIGDLELLIRDQQPIILAIQEPHRISTDGLNRSLRGQYKWTLKCNENVYHSAAIGILSSVPHSSIPLDTDLPIVGVRLDYPFPLTVISGYLPNGNVPNLETQLMDILKSLDTPSLILWDTNGHHTEWGSPSSNARGSLIMRIAESLDLVVLNDGAVTFTRGDTQSTVDISLSSVNITNRLSWTAGEDPLGSDHHPITIRFDEQPVAITRRPRWKYDQANWSQFQETLDTTVADMNPNNIDDFLNAVHHAASSTIPRTKGNSGRKSLPWWSPDVKKIIKERRKALRAAKRLPKDHPNKDHADEVYRKKRNECRQLIREAKRKSWEDFLEGINANQTSSDLWNRVNALSGKRRATGMTLQVAGGLTRDPHLIANKLADYFESLSSLGQYDNSFIRRNHVSINSIQNIAIPEDTAVPLPINSPFRLEELNFALRRSKGKSAGPDELGYPMFQNLTINSKATFLELLNKTWTENTLPKSWTHSLVVPIPKVGKVTKSPSDFRPISLTCCASKILERMVNRRLSRFLEDNQLLDHRQHAFRPGHGTGTYFTGLGDVLQDAMNKELHVDIASLDLAKAYNRAWTPKAINQLSEWGLSGHILHFLKNFLSGRTFQVIIGNHSSSTRKEETGVPQGSVIAVTIFLVLMNSVFDSLPKEIYIFVYADDIVLLVVGRTLKFIRRKLQAAVTAVARWALHSGFKLSAEKSVISHVCRYRHRMLSSPVKTNGSPIPMKKTVVILGIRLDRELRFEDHLRDTKKNCQTRLNILRTLSKPHRSSNRGTLLKVSKAIVNSRLLYGIELFCLAEDSLILSQLGPTYNQSIRIISSLLPSTPADAACIELGVLPFRYQMVETLCCRTIGYLEKTTGDHEVFLLREANRALANLAHLELPPVEQVHWVGARRWDAANLHVDLSIANRFRAGDNSIAMRSHVTELLARKYYTHQLRYTDGSKTRGRTGFGVTDTDSSHFFQLPNQCSVFSAEAAAILLAITTPASKPICVISDSASVLSTINSPTTQHPWIQAIQKDCPARTVFLWVPGHCGIQGNVEADHLAAIGRTGRMFTRLTPGADLKHWLKSTIRVAWAQEWANVRQPFIRKIKGEITQWTDTTNRHDQLILSRLRVGHTHATHNMGSTGPFRRICSTCNITMTVEHLLVNCPFYQGIRDRYDISNNIRDILANDPARETALISFIKDGGLHRAI